MSAPEPSASSDDPFARSFGDPPPWRTWLIMAVVCVWLLLVVIALSYQPN